MRALIAAAAAALVGAAAPAAAQSRYVTVHGIAYDSLHGTPLEGAVISVAGVGRTTVADRRGRFEIDSVAPGVHTFTMNHDALDSLGLAGVSARVEVTDGRAEVRLAIPAFAAFWARGCARPAPRDSILVYGAVRDPATLAPVAGATVEVAWLDLSVRGRRDVRQQVQTLSVTTDANGTYGFCGVPAATPLRIRASTDTSSSGVIDLAPRPDRVRWRDLTVGPLAAHDSSRVGVIAGVVLRGDGQPVAGARIAMDEVPETRTDAAGKFRLVNVPAGTRQFQVLAIGTDAVSRVVDVAVNRTSDVVVNMEPLTTLAPARVTGTAFIRRMAEGLAERRKSSFGVFLDSSDFVGQGTTRTAFEGIAGLAVRPYGRNYNLVLKESAVRECLANVFIDGERAYDQERLWTLNPGDIKAVEVYRRGSTVPPEFQVLRSTCGSVAVWTRRTFP